MTFSPPSAISTCPAAEFVKRCWGGSPRFGMILGTGSGGLADEIDASVKIPYGDIPGFPRSTSLGHAGQFVCGTLAGADVIAMEGRFHLYEGYCADQVTLPVEVMYQLGVKTLFVSNASGGVNPAYSKGDIMLIDSHIDLMYCLTTNVSAPAAGPPPVCRDVYDRRLIHQAEKCARACGQPIHRGVYLSMLGPNYETRAEYRFVRQMGADVVGMSTVPEVTVAGRYRMQVLGMSIVANIARPDILVPTSGQEVIDSVASAGPLLKSIVIDAIECESDR